MVRLARSTILRDLWTPVFRNSTHSATLTHGRPGQILGDHEQVPARSRLVGVGSVSLGDLAADLGPCVTSHRIQ